MIKTVCTIILAVFAYGCAVPINASEKEVSTREDAREAALWKIMTSVKK